jgi:general secretion pathway protein G
MSFRSRISRKRQAGFSLIEFTVVLALIGLLAGLVTIGVRPLMTRGKKNAARQEIATIKTALESYFSQYGHYPTTDEGIEILTKKDKNTGAPLLTKPPIDPWNKPYIYTSPGRNEEPYEVICFGADGREGGTGADEDIVSWDLKEKQDK